MRISSHILAGFKNFEKAEKVALSFSGCGFLGAYNFGAAKCIVEKSKDLMPKVVKIGGASAGSLVATILVLAPEKIDDGLETLYEMADDVHSMPFGAISSGYYLQNRLVKVIDRFLPLDITKAQGKLHVSVTKLRSWENVMISEFDSREHLISILLASCYIPMYSLGYRGEAPIINDEKYIDGGMSNNLPIFLDCPTITCSPFSSSADICPEDISNWNVTFGKQVFKASSQNLYRGARALFPPSRLILKEYTQMGYDDADRFLNS